MKKRIISILAAVLLILAFTATPAAAAEQNVSNQLTLGGGSNPPVPVLVLAWTNIEGGTITGGGTGGTATWYVGTPYSVTVSNTNTLATTSSGIYAKLTGWNPAQFKIEYLNTYPGLPANTYTDLGDGSATATACGFGVGTAAYYFGPKGTGDSYTGNQIKSFTFRITPLQVVSPVNLSIVDVIGVTDTR